MWIQDWGVRKINQPSLKVTIKDVWYYSVRSFTMLGYLYFAFVNSYSYRLVIYMGNLLKGNFLGFSFSANDVDVERRLQISSVTWWASHWLINPLQMKSNGGTIVFLAHLSRKLIAFCLKFHFFIISRISIKLGWVI